MQDDTPISPHELLKLASTGTRAQLLAAIQFLDLQLTIQRRRLPSPMRLTPAERRKMRRLGAAVGDKRPVFLRIVTEQTYHRWGRHPSPAARTAKLTGRPLRPAAIERLVVQMAEDNQWGRTRIHGELRKLGLGNAVSRTTVGNILIAHGFDPGPKRGTGTWDDFIAAHRTTLWACDFFTKKVRTPRGIREDYILFFKHIDSRHVIITGSTPHPNRHWVAQQARNFCMSLQEHGLEATHLIRDHDTKFYGGFDDVLNGEGITVVKSAVRVPEMNGFAESFVKTIKTECLDHFTVFGEDHLNHLLREFIDFYNTVRPHRGLDNKPIGMDEAERHSGDFSLDDIVCETRLGGVLKHYRWKEAA